MDDVPLFDRQPSEFTFEDFKRLYDDEVSPVTFEHDDEMHEEFREAIQYGSTREQHVEGLGTFKTLSEWSGGDQRPMGIATAHVESGTIIILLGTYSSWDSSDWHTFSEAEAYHFSETRYRPVKK